MRRDRDREQDDLLAAYLDGVTELTTEERRAVEARLAGDGALREEAAETRAILDQLRELPRDPAAAGEPDWAALERSILGAVGPEVPRPWWRRFGWRLALPAVALAMGVAVLALVARTPDRAGEPAPAISATPATATPRADAPATPRADAPDAGGTMALWLDGADLEIELSAEDLLEVPWEGDHRLEDLLPASDLAWVDELADEELERAEALAEGLAEALGSQQERKPPVRRKRS